MRFDANTVRDGFARPDDERGTLQESAGTGSDLPPSDERFRLDYEGRHHIEGPWCTVDIYRRDAATVIVATDETDKHQDCSVTNRVERVMFLAWERAGRPWPCIFVEHYRDSPVVSSHFDVAMFDLGADGPRTVDYWAAGRVVGQQFNSLQWRPLSWAPNVAQFLTPAVPDVPPAKPKRQTGPPPLSAEEQLLHDAILAAIKDGPTGRERWDLYEDKIQTRDGASVERFDLAQAVIDRWRKSKQVDADQQAADRR